MNEKILEIDSQKISTGVHEKDANISSSLKDIQTASDSNHVESAAAVFRKPLPVENSSTVLNFITAIETENPYSETVAIGQENVPVTESGDTNSLNGSKINLPTQKIPYEEPTWGGLPDVKYSLEEIKNGATLKTISLQNRSFFSFGRLDNCHVVMAHPTVSRYHAILQYRSTFVSTDEKKGFYIYDLGSTHGTYVNKYRVIPKTYVKLQVGHMIKFGSSTRFFLLNGPQDDQEDESEHSYTEMKEMRKRDLEKRDEENKREMARLNYELTEEEEARGIDWGMGEDADAESDLKENPFALTANEDMYRDDPKKVLRCWFEREGEELTYRIEEKGYGHFRCTIELPVENATGGVLVAEATVSGRKKEAAFQCALEACRMLDRANLLRQNNQEARKRKIKNWEEDDYYESDEDNFFDQTGDLEKKRIQRMIHLKKSKPETETYETLVEKHKNLIMEIEHMERKLSTMLAEASCCRDDDDNWDSFTSQNQSGQTVDKLTLRKLKKSVSSLRLDEEKLRKLINFVKPFEIPEINPPPVVKKEPVDELLVIRNVPDEKLHIESTSTSKNSPIGMNVDVKTTIKSETTQNTAICQSEVATTVAETSEPTLSSSDAKKPSRPRQDRAKKIAMSFSNIYEEDFNNIVWTPPSGQTGDGRTSLNDKLGY